LVRILRENLTMDSHVITVRTGDRPAVNDVTAEAQAFVDAYAHGADGLLHVFVPHATAGIAIIETGAGSDDDLLTSIDEVLPPGGRWRHRHGSPGHGRDHVLPAYISPAATFPVISGRIALGTWQSICLVDPNVDNAVRQVRFSFLAG
jgi:secondary thiamine-phosphate synthase enzyme